MATASRDSTRYCPVTLELGCSRCRRSVDHIHRTNLHRRSGGEGDSKASASRHRLPVGTLGEVLSNLPESLSLIEGGHVAKSHLVSLGGRDLVRDLAVPVGPDERVIVIDALAGG